MQGAKKRHVVRKNNFGAKILGLWTDGKKLNTICNNKNNSSKSASAVTLAVQEWFDGTWMYTETPLNCSAKRVLLNLTPPSLNDRPKGFRPTTSHLGGCTQKGQKPFDKQNPQKKFLQPSAFSRSGHLKVRVISYVLLARARSRQKEKDTQLALPANKLMRHIRKIKHHCLTQTPSLVNGLESTRNLRPKIGAPFREKNCTYW